MPLLEVRDLTVRIRDVPRPVVRDASFQVEKGSILGLVGETGAGKTITTRAILGLVSNADIRATKLTFDGIDLQSAPADVWRRLRGGRIGIVVQDARSALYPLQAVGKSVLNILQAHERCSAQEARNRILGMFEQVGLPDPENVMHRLPHELSGGMAQRVMIGAALITNPDLIIADEATTGLDVTIQAKLLDLLRSEIDRRNAAAIVVTHDLGIVAHYCTDVAIMYAGRIREYGTVRSVFHAPAHPYTARLLQATRGDVERSSEEVPWPRSGPGCEYADACPYREAICLEDPLPVQTEARRFSLCRLPIGALARPARPPLDQPKPFTVEGKSRQQVGSDPPLMEAALHEAEPRALVRTEGLRKVFTVRGRKRLHAVNGVSLEVASGECVALVGESGAGKSTIGRCILRLIDVDDGTIVLEGVDVTRETKMRFRHRRADIQVVFQDPASSLNSRMRAVEIIREPLDIFRRNLTRKDRQAEALRLIASVRFAPDLADRYPRHLSGGQQQRVAIARALATRPRLIVLDEPTASLDMSVRDQCLSLLERLQRDFGLSYILISHDLRTVRRIACRIIVLYLGEIVEAGATHEVFAHPRHPYTRALLSASLVPDPDSPVNRTPIEGEMPKPTDLPTGCYFSGRCPYVIDECRAGHPALVMVTPHHSARCIRLEFVEQAHPV